MHVCTPTSTKVSDEVTFEQRPECHLKLWREIPREGEGDRRLASLTSKCHEVEKDLREERLGANTLRKPYRILVNIRRRNWGTAVTPRLPLLPRGRRLCHSDHCISRRVSELGSGVEPLVASLQLTDALGRVQYGVGGSTELQHRDYPWEEQGSTCRSRVARGRGIWTPAIEKLTAAS